jgi:hypothetical protein
MVLFLWQPICVRSTGFLVIVLLLQEILQVTLPICWEIHKVLARTDTALYLSAHLSRETV